MIAIWGLYKFGKKPIAYKRNYCQHCQKATTQIRIRTFFVMHYFWIPFLPLGLYRIWKCDHCGKHPSSTYPAITGAVIVLALAAFVGAFAMWNAKDMQIIRFILLFSGLVLGAWPILNHRANRKAVELMQTEFKSQINLSEQPCYFCQSKIEKFPDPHCSNCDVKVIETH